MSEQRNRDHQEPADEQERRDEGQVGSPADRAGDAGRVVSDAAAGVTGLGAGLLGGLAGALDGLVGGLTGERASERRTQIHPWDLPSASEGPGEPDSDTEKSDASDGYDEDYDRIH